VTPVVPPPPAPCFPVQKLVGEAAAEFTVDPTPCLVELAATSQEPKSERSETTAEIPMQCEMQVEEFGAESELLLPDSNDAGCCQTPYASSSGTCHSSRDFITPPSGVDSQSLSRTDPRREYHPRSPLAVALLMSPSVSVSCVSSSQPSPRPAPPRCSPLVVAGPGSFADVEQQQPEELRAPESAEFWPNCDETAWLRAARRTLLPLGVSPWGHSLDWEHLVESSSLAALDCCCAPQVSRPSVVQTSGQCGSAGSTSYDSDAVAIETRLLQVPRPSLQGLRVAGAHPVLARQKASSTDVPQAFKVSQPKCPRSTVLPALPRQAPALPTRSHGSDLGADAAEQLLAKIVDPFAPH
jgi:hypothetical protein